MSESIKHTLEELLQADEWYTTPPRYREGDPILISESKAIELALSTICGKTGTSVCIKERLLRPKYCKRPYFVFQLSGEPGPDEQGWYFSFEYSMPEGFEDRSKPVFVNDPSGIVEYAGCHCRQQPDL